MPSQNQLNQIRRAFQIPDSVVIISSRAFFPPPPVTPARQPGFQIDQTATADPVLYRSSLGTPVYTNITFLAGQYSLNTPINTPSIFKSYGPLTYEAVIITVSQAKKVIKTEIQGRNGTAKEYIGDDDYIVTINGIITGANGHYPQAEVIALKALLDAPTEIAVASTYLLNLGIDTLVVESYEFAQTEGGYSYQTFSITCSSDAPSPAVSERSANLSQVTFPDNLA